MASLPSARTIAARVLERVARDGAFAAAALTAELDRHPQLDERERALATELVYGVLRTKAALVERLERCAARGLDHKDTAVLSELCISAYQILLLDRVPDFAAVDHAVSAVRRLRGPRVAGFANALLRSLARQPKLDFAQAVIANVPAWLFSKLVSAVGESEARALVGAADDGARGAASTALRLRSDGPWPWLDRTTPGRASPHARLTGHRGDPRRWEGYDRGAFVVQEEGAQVVGLAVGACPGERVLDACAGRGQKTSLIADRVGSSGVVWAVDQYPAKLDQLRAEFSRLALPSPELTAVDWTVGSGAVPSDFDRVLVDAPCTGVGTLRRRPEILGRLAPDDPARLGALAAQILLAAARHARPGGRVLFAVCSVLPEESDAVVEKVRGTLDPVLEPAPFDAPELTALVGPEQTALCLLPGRHGTDGYFLQSFVRRG
jgi:16S rRNA (cytosine967-C5)-methyltransferase